MARDSGLGGGCLTFIIFGGFVIFSNIQIIVALLVIVLVLIIFVGLLMRGGEVLINYLSRNKEKKVIEKRKEDELLKFFLKECKQDGSVKEIEELKKLIEQNIKTNGSDIEFLELNFSVAKIYNSGIDSSKATIYFEKVKSIISHLSYEDICLAAKKSIDDKKFHDAVFYYTYTLLYDKVKDIKESPEIYYNRAIVYLELNQNKLAINDIESAIEKTKAILNTLNNMPDGTLLKSRLDMYNYRLAEEYAKLKQFEQAIRCYKEISESYNKYTEVQSKIQECQSLFNEQKLNNSHQQMINTLKNHIAQKENNLKKQEKHIQTSRTKSSNKKINLQSCTEEDLLTIDGFDLSKATKFLKERMNGKVYYDLETFVEDFGLQPHQMIEAQDRIIFPPKPKNKIGRKIDW